ncbi:MAG: SusC/RagA family TonB-linked outer membrane protein [Flavisolibacter sp.]|nr:SusC/RagA family TonB-linked outer membrane protein [Flavisolibacter sp.]
MRKLTSPQLLSLLVATCLFIQNSFSQSTVSGTVTDQQSQKGIPGVSVTVKGTNVGTVTDNNGAYRISAASSGSLIFSSVGYSRMEIPISGRTTVDVIMVPTNASLSEVVLIGYGTARRRDLSGSYATVTAKNFNVVPSATPDQLLQGRVPGVQITVASGQPGAPTSVKIRGNNSIRAGTNPLYVLDGVPLDGRSARPTFTNISGLNNLPESNPLNFLNPADIESITVLKDASASAIYGSRGANGVILITTRSGASGPLKIDVGTSWTVSGLLKKPDVLNAGQYRSALQKYNAKSDSGATFTPFNEIIQHKVAQNYSLALSGGGSEDARYKASFYVSRTPGIIRKSAFNKYIGNFNGSFRFLDQKLTMSFGLTAASTNEQIAPVSNDVGSTGNLISNALQWNPTLPMKRSDGSYVTNPNGQVNPLIFSDAYNDHADVTTLFGYLTAGYKILPSLEYRLLYGANQSRGTRGLEIQGWITGTGGNADGKGLAAIGATQLASQTISHTLTYTKQSTGLGVTALVGYEYGKNSYKTQFTSVYGFNYNLDVNNLIPVHYYDNIQAGARANLTTSSSYDPAVELQSYFARAQLNFHERYSLSASFRADGSNKFGKNNKYAYFPAVAGKWHISSENFMKGAGFFDDLGLRVGWGRTGNQSFPAGAAVDRYRYTSNGSLSVINFANPNLKWETVESTNAGIDFAILHNRLTGSLDVFMKKTKDPLFPGTLSAPAPSGIIWENLPGYISNKGGEVGLNGVVISKTNLHWNIGANLTYVKNKFVYPPIGNSPLVLTGQLNGKGTSQTWVQAIANDQPIDVFFLRQFHGFDKDGFAITDGSASYAGDPNPRYVVGISSELDLKKLSVQINMHGAYHYYIYNNTLQSVTGLGFITNGSNISKQLINTEENIANPVSASTRYMQKGNFMKLGNATIRYRVGDIGNVIRNFSVYVSGYNVFIITKYKGFDPEVDVSKTDFFSTGIPSIGIDYVGYPSIRSFTFGLNFSVK